MPTEHPADSVVIALSARARPDAKMHVAARPFNTGQPWTEVRTLCGRSMVPGTVFAPAAWYRSAHLARTHQTGHCLDCLGRTTD